MERVLTQLNQLIWGQGMTVLLILSALYFVCFARRYPLMRVKRRSSGEQKSKDAFFTALAGTLGIGGMVGVAAALAMGGAGAVFWMGVSALAGMVLKYVEVTLSCASQVKRRRAGAAARW
ncbi:MAG: alanine:cation symporter family protein [Merdibacter sp.]